MTRFLFVYHGGNQPESPEEGEKVKKDWDNWFETMGDSVSDSGAPVGNAWTVHRSRIVTSDGGNNPARRKSIVQAADREAAIELAKGCPVIEANGDVEIAEVMNI